MKTVLTTHRALAVFAVGITAGAALLSGCSTDQATTAVQQTEEAPGAYSNAINRAKAVAGTEEQHNSAAYLDRQTGANKGDAGGGLAAPPAQGAPGVPGAPR